MIYLHKILPALALPIMLVIGLIIFGLWKHKPRVIILAISLLYIMSTPIFSKSLAKIVEGGEIRKTLEQVKNADAIVVLSGMIGFTKINDVYAPQWGGSPDRFFGGINLIKTNKAKILVFTGAKMPWNKQRETEGEVLKKYAIEFGIPDSLIKLTDIVETSEDESKAVRRLIGENKKVILVTSAFHMSRAKRLFLKAGIQVETYPVDFKVGNTNVVTLIDFMPSAASLALTETGIREMIGRLFYLTRDCALSD